MTNSAYRLSSTPSYRVSREMRQASNYFSKPGLPCKFDQFFDLSTKIGVQIKPVFQSKKISQVLSPKEKKPPIVNNPCVVYKCRSDLCDTDYVGYTTRHLHQRIGEHKHSPIGRHLEDHGLSKSDLKDKQFSVSRKCRSKFEWLIFEMMFIKELKPGLNTQKDSVGAKLLT